MKNFLLGIWVWVCFVFFWLPENAPLSTAHTFFKLIPLNFNQICLEPTALQNKIDFLLVILKGFSKLWVNWDNHVLYMRYFIGLLQLFKTCTKAFMKNSLFFSKTSAYLLSFLSEGDPRTLPHVTWGSLQQ